MPVRPISALLRWIASLSRRIAFSSRSFSVIVGLDFHRQAKVVARLDEHLLTSLDQKLSRPLAERIIERVQHGRRVDVERDGTWPPAVVAHPQDATHRH